MCSLGSRRWHGLELGVLLSMSAEHHRVLTKADQKEYGVVLPPVRVFGSKGASRQHLSLELRFSPKALFQN